MKKLTWNNIPLYKMEQIEKALSLKDDLELTLELIRIIYEIDPEELPIYQLTEYAETLRDLGNAPTPSKIGSKYKVNGHNYKTNTDLSTIKTAQFIDYQNYVKKEHPKYEEILSVFFIPEGHQYNDGYDMQEVWKDLAQLDMGTVTSIHFFMKAQLKTLLAVFQFYLTTYLKKNTENQKLVEAVNIMDFSSLV